MLLSQQASAQLKKSIENLAKDPITIENAAKADVYILSKKKIITNDRVKPGTQHAVDEIPDRRRKLPATTCKS